MNFPSSPTRRSEVSWRDDELLPPVGKVTYFNSWLSLASMTYPKIICWGFWNCHGWTLQIYTQIHIIVSVVWVWRLTTSGTWLRRRREQDSLPGCIHRPPWWCKRRPKKYGLPSGYESSLAWAISSWNFTNLFGYLSRWKSISISLNYLRVKWFYVENTQWLVTRRPK